MKVLLFGDSITAYIPKDKLNMDWSYNLKKNIENGNDNYTFYNCGIENYTTEYLRKTFARVDTTHYNKIICQFGINDFIMPYQDEDYTKKTPEQIYNSIVSLLGYIITTSGKTVALQSLYPATNGISTPSVDICYVNTKLATFCKKNNIEYINMYALLGNQNGEYKNGLSDDGLHPNNKGYELVTNMLLQSCNIKNKLEQNEQSL